LAVSGANLRTIPVTILLGSMAPVAFVAPVVDSTAVFKENIFEGRVLFCTGGGSGICRAMTEAMVGLRQPKDGLKMGMTLLLSILDAAWCSCSDSWAKVSVSADGVVNLLNDCTRLDRLTQTAKELSEATKRPCIPAQADVRDTKTLHAAVQTTMEKFGRIDFVICGKATPDCPESLILVLF